MKSSGYQPESFDSFTSLLKRSAPYFLAALILYLPAFDNGFLEDDFVFLEHVRSVGWLGSVLSPDTHFAFCRPGALLLFRAEYLFFGLDGGLYVAFNFLVHLLTAVAGGAVLSRMNLQRSTVLAAVALFLLGYGHCGKQVMWASASGPLIANLLLVLAPAFHESAIITAWLVFMVPERGSSLTPSGARYGSGTFQRHVGDTAPRVLWRLRRILAFGNDTSGRGAPLGALPRFPGRAGTAGIGVGGGGDGRHPHIPYPGARDAEGGARHHRGALGDTPAGAGEEI